MPLQEILKHSKAGLTQSPVGSLGPGAHKVLAGMGFDSKRNFAPATILLGLLLCPGTWDIIFWWDPTFSC